MPELSPSTEPAWHHLNRPLRVVVVGHPQAAEALSNLAADIFRIDHARAWSEHAATLVPERFDVAIVGAHLWSKEDGSRIARKLRERLLGVVLVVPSSQDSLLKRYLGIIESETGTCDSVELESAVTAGAYQTWALGWATRAADLSPGTLPRLASAEPHDPSGAQAPPTQPDHVLPLVEPPPEPLWNELIEAEKTDWTWHLALGLIALATLLAISTGVSILV